MFEDAIDEKRVFIKILEQFKHANLVTPRGLLIKELEDFTYTIPPYVRFQNFKSRKLNLSYCKREFLWYLRGDRFDTSICDHAKMWRDLVNADGSINSNYGQYIFGSMNQFDNALKTLISDKDSRRASIVILNSGHLSSNTKDVPCTYSINFRIRDDELKMSVMMRSQDAIYGMGNDLPTFSFIHEMMFNALKPVYPNIRYGTYTHTTNSFHVYQRHFKMLESILNGDVFESIECPKIESFEEVTFLRRLEFHEIPEKFRFTKWLVDQ